jgi:predicted proteasome-type protease
MDSTLKSNLSVGLPLDMVVYEADRFQTDRVMCIDDQNPYFQMLHGSLGPEAARGVRQHRRPDLGWRRHQLCP